MDTTNSNQKKKLMKIYTWQTKYMYGNKQTQKNAKKRLYLLGLSYHLSQNRTEKPRQKRA